MRDYLKNVPRALGEVFTHVSYSALASTLAVAAFLFAVWFPNLGLMSDLFFTSSVPFADKLKVTFSLLRGISTNFSALSAGYTVTIAALFGVNIAMVVYFLKRKKNLIARREAAVGFGGVASGVLGIGCAACGSFILSTTLSSFGAAGALAILPFRGGEFGILSVALLALSLLLISKKIAAPLTCDPTPQA